MAMATKCISDFERNHPFEEENPWSELDIFRASSLPYSIYSANSHHKDGSYKLNAPKYCVGLIPKNNYNFQDQETKALGKHPIMVWVIWSTIAIPWSMLVLADKVKPVFNFIGRLADPRLSGKQKLPGFLRKD